MKNYPFILLLILKKKYFYKYEMGPLLGPTTHNTIEELLIVNCQWLHREPRTQSSGPT